MSLVERVADLEREVDHLRAVVDGGEAQAREAVVVAFGLAASFAARSGALDLDRLIEFLAEEADPEPGRDDKTGTLIHGIRLILAFHRDLEAGRPRSSGASIDDLTENERAAILRRAAAMVDFDRENARGTGTGPAARSGETGPSGH